MTVGNFDGVHRGHQRLITSVVEAARQQHAEAVVVTFDPHPLVVLRPAHGPRRLTTIDHRTRLLRKHGIDRVVVVPFTLEVSGWSPSLFVERVLRVPELGTVEVHVGDNFRFGSQASGDVQTLTGLGWTAGFSVKAVPLAGDTGHFSSTAVRAFLDKGDLKSVAAILGRPHETTGILTAGPSNQERTLHVDGDMALPSRGFYSCVLRSPDDLPFDVNVTVHDRAHEGGLALAVHPRGWTGELPALNGLSEACLSWYDRLGGPVRLAAALA